MSKPSVDSVSDYEKFSPSSFIVFIAGGMTYGELKLPTLLTEYFKERAKTPQNINVIFGSTQILNPDDFIEKLLVLNPDDPQFKDEDDNFEQDVLIPNVKSEILEKVIEYCEHYKKVEEKVKPVNSKVGNH